MSRGVKKRSPKASAMGLSATTLESPFPAPTRIVVFPLSEAWIPDMDHCPLWGCLLKIIVTVEDIGVVDGHHFVAANFDSQLLHDGAAQILNHSPVGIFPVQSDREDQPRGPGDNHIVFANVWEPDKQLLVLVDAARIVGNDHRLPHSFDTQRLAEGVVRIKLAPKFARSQCVLLLLLHCCFTSTVNI